VGQGGNGKQRTGRATGLVATAALGLGLVVGGLLGHGRAAVAPGTSPAGATTPHVYVALGDRDDPRFGVASAFVPISPPTARATMRSMTGRGPGVTGAATHGSGPADEYTRGEGVAAPRFIPDQFTYREDHRGER